MRQGIKTPNFLQPHLADAKKDAKTAWPFTERPESVVERARKVFPAKGEVPHWGLWLPAAVVGGIALAVSTLLRLADLAFSTRRRAAASTAAIVLTVLAHKIARALAG